MSDKCANDDLRTDEIALFSHRVYIISRERNCKADYHLCVIKNLIAKRIILRKTAQNIYTRPCYSTLVLQPESEVREISQSSIIVFYAGVPNIFERAAPTGLTVLALGNLGLIQC